MEEEKTGITAPAANINESKSDESVDADYIQVISDLKANTVSKAEYQKLKDENRKLLQAYASGQNLPDEYRQKAEAVDLDALRKDLFTKDHTNLEYIENALKLREELLKRGETDPFLPQGKNILATSEDKECANRVASVLQECVDYADGDSAIFTNELQRRMVDAYPGKRRK